MERDSFINEILSSTNGMAKVAPDTDLFSKIEQKILASATVSSATLWWAAASAAVLVMINISVISTEKAVSENQAVISLVSELNNSNQLY